jgi:hypothetical protein
MSTCELELLGSGTSHGFETARFFRIMLFKVMGTLFDEIS